MDIFLEKTVENIRLGKKPSGKTIEKITLSSDIVSLFPFTNNIHQICFMLANDIKDPPKCQHCKIEPASFKSISKGFGKYCSTDCYSSHLSVYNKNTNHTKNKARSKKLYASREQILNEAKEYYTNNLVKISEVAERFSLPYSTLRDFLSKSNLVKYENQSLFKSQNFLSTVDERINDVDFLKKCSEDGLSLEEVAKKLNVCANTVRLYALKHGIKFFSQSKYEREILAFVEKYDEYVCKTREIISPYEIDIFSKKHNFGVELHGEFWHCEDKVNDSYHLKKQILAEQNNIELIQIFSHEWETKENIVKSMIGYFLDINKKVYAEKLRFKEITKTEAKVFFENNHLQGWLDCEIVFGLVDELEYIVSAISFDKPRFEKNCEYEVLRFCNKLNTNVIGGFSKLIRDSQKQLNFNSIIMYIDRRLFAENLYEMDNFVKIKETEPDFFWYSIKTKDIVTQITSNLTKDEIEHKNALGYRRVFDCGQFVYKYTTHP